MYPMSNMWHFPAAHSLYDRVREDKPVALFSRVPNVVDKEGSKCDHVVVAYEVHRKATKGAFGIKSYSNYEYRVHYGWKSDNNKNNVVLSHSTILIGGMVNLHKKEREK